jgi:asparagine synthase (glutamine-hydrolysing)
MSTPRPSPANLKLSGLKDKLILRKLGARHLPQDISARPKQPYRAPTTTSFFGPGAPGYVRELLSPDMLAAHGLVEVEPARMLADKAWAREGRLSGEREEMALIGVLSLQILAQWLRHELPQTVATDARRLRKGAPSVLIDRCAA